MGVIYALCLLALVATTFDIKKHTSDIKKHQPDILRLPKHPNIAPITSSPSKMIENIKAPMVLSGGGARGFAHVGILQALEESGIFPSAIAATSAGALIGAFIADGFRAAELKELVLKNVRLSLLVDFSNIRSGVISLNKLGEFIGKNLRHQRIEDLPIPFYPTVTDMRDGSQVIFKSGEIVPAILAASSIPGVFSPVQIGGVPFGDGGLYNNLPVEPLADRKGEIIAIHVNPVSPFEGQASFAKIVDRSIHLSFQKTVKASADGCRLFIEPPGLSQFGMFDVQKLNDIYETGYQYTKALLNTV